MNHLTPKPKPDLRPHRPFRGLPLTIESNGPDGYTLTDLRTGRRKAYAIARPVCKCAKKTRTKGAQPS